MFHLLHLRLARGRTVSSMLNFRWKRHPFGLRVGARGVCIVPPLREENQHFVCSLICCDAFYCHTGLVLTALRSISIYSECQSSKRQGRLYPCQQREATFDWPSRTTTHAQMHFAFRSEFRPLDLLQFSFSPVSLSVQRIHYRY